MSVETARRLAALLTGLWAGAMLAIGALVAPVLFATLPLADAGRVAGRLFAQEAPGSIAVAVVVLVLERWRLRDVSTTGGGSSQFTPDFGLALGVVFCSVAGYYAVQPMMEAARAGEGRLSFGALHGISTVFFGLKGLLMLALAWRLTGRRRPPITPTGTS